MPRRRVRSAIDVESNPCSDVARSAPALEGFLPIEGVGHWPQLEASEIVNEALVDFLGRRKG
jgi:pimeloyl-ACP methyl ester carboxylesterase